MKYPLVIFVMLLGLCGCAQHQPTYEEAVARFSVGMTPDQARQLFGKPSDKSLDENGDFWTYTPERKIKSGPPGEYSGFTIIFKQGKAVEILKHDIVKN